MREPTWGPLSGSHQDRFRDRHEAGRALATRLATLLSPEPTDGPSSAAEDSSDSGVVVLGLPRGGVPVAAEIAWKLGAPLDVIVVRKLGVPFQPELAMGAIGEGGVRILNKHLIRQGHVTADQVAAVEEVERARLDVRLERYRSGRPGVPLTGRTVIVVDDGAATGATARAACEVARAHGASRVVLALPVAAPQVAVELREVADDVVCLHTPSSFQAVGQWYLDFSQTSDEEVEALLQP